VRLNLKNDSRGLTFFHGGLPFTHFITRDLTFTDPVSRVIPLGNRVQFRLLRNIRVLLQSEFHGSWQSAAAQSQLPRVPRLRLSTLEASVNHASSKSGRQSDKDDLSGRETSSACAHALFNAFTFFPSQRLQASGTGGASCSVD
jgi:hypothetical protein